MGKVQLLGSGFSAIRNNAKKKITPNLKMAYEYTQNIIFVNPNAQFVDKSDFLSLLRHEYQHYKQYMNVFRHPEKGDEAVKMYSKSLANAQVQNIDNQIRNLSIEELKSIGYPEEALLEAQKLKDFLSKNQISEYESCLQETLKELEELNINSIGNFRTAVVEELGLLKDGSREAGRAKKYFEATAAENSYFQKDGNIDYGKYCFDIRENEAVAAQDMIRMFVDKNHSCYPKYMREATIPDTPEQEKVLSDVNKHMETLNTKGVSFKEIISYLFD